MGTINYENAYSEDTEKECPFGEIIRSVPETGALKVLREKAGYTQKRLAEAVGVDIRRIQRLEKGEIKVENITAKKFLALADALQVDPHQLLEKIK